MVGCLLLTLQHHYHDEGNAKLILNAIDMYWGHKWGHTSRCSKCLQHFFLSRTVLLCAPLPSCSNTRVSPYEHNFWVLIPSLFWPPVVHQPPPSPLPPPFPRLLFVSDWWLAVTWVEVCGMSCTKWRVITGFTNHVFARLDFNLYATRFSEIRVWSFGGGGDLVSCFFFFWPVARKSRKRN